MIRKAISLVILVLSFTTMNLNAQEKIKLWTKSAPTDNRITTPEKLERNGTWASNISEAELHIYKATRNIDGKVVIICPGGGYSGLAMSHEGKVFAEWLNSKGITAIVLKYRMPNKQSAVPLEDAQQAIRYVRENATRLAINPNKVGIAGFSAGGHLATTASTHFATEGTSTRPDFSILYYPVVTMKDETHHGSRDQLLGDKASSVDIYRFSNEEQVNVNTPPTILFLSDDDKVVLPINSTQYYNNLKKNDIPVAMYIFPEGGHGWGFGASFKYHKEMTSLLEKWLADK